MQAKYILGLAACGAMLIAAGCRKTNMVDKSAFKSAINDYYQARQACVWSSPKKFPAQADTSNDDQTKGFDALTDAGLLVRKSAEKKRFLIGSKQVNDYDLSDKGRTTWTADQTQPGYGNFCFGHREVTTVDSFTPADNPDATQFTVTYHYDVASVPDWANSAEMKTAFPKVANDTSGQQSATATLVKTNSGWQVTSPQASTDSTITN
ncbi:hypothetical protein [Terracidiphilus gabretensis]|uniref:hypothetical protein n=1 Tax=Terracidiphilus gabretensis TaxID=1577687 RepID=UPI00071B11E8|nr:hypothetical protein [Terracidiphilus gabretensis]